MRYIMIALVIPPSLYSLSFASYSWRKKEKLTAMGSGILGVLAIALPVLFLLIR